MNDPSNEELLRELFESAPDAVLVVDHEGHIALANAQTEKLFGYLREELIGKPLEMLVPERMRESHVKHRQAFAQRPAVRPMGAGLDLWARRRDGAEFPVEISLSPLRTRSGMFISAIRDIAERKRVEQALQEAHGKLELRVRERTRELTRLNESLRAEISERARAESELAQARKMEAVGQLTGGIAHDFNNLLTVISGNLQMLLGRVADNPGLLKLAGSAMKAADRGAQLIQRLLAFSRRQALQPRNVNLNQIVIGMADLLRRSLGETIQIEIASAPQLPNIVVDPGQLENALLNLALNARDAMPAGGTLTIETGEVEIGRAYADGIGLVAGRYATLAVSDTGTGMAREVLEHAFEPFFTTKKSGQGSGMGLAMVYGFARQSAGHVKIRSEPGQGTTVTLYLPLAKGSVEKSELPPDSEHAKILGQETVLVVEDDDAVRELALAFLSDLGYRTIEAPNSEVALAHLGAGVAIDLLFTDVVMPGLNGPELAAEALRLRPQLKVLFTSGYAEHALIHQDKLDEGVQLISKPYSKEALARKIRVVLGTH
jgi:PAS domain S-box-containing protein